MNEALTTIINNVYPLSKNALNGFLDLIEIRTFDKLAEVIPYSSNNYYEYILLDGVCRSYIINYQGNEATLSFYTTGNVFPPNQIRTIHEKALYAVQCITPVTIALFNKVEFVDLMRRHSEIEKWGHAVYDAELKNKVRKELAFVTLPAKERLSFFRQQYPTLENLIPHAFIASYLGITTVSLSRLRGKK